MKYLKAVKETQRYYFLVHIDEKKKLEGGSPDPAFVREYEWSTIPPDGVTEEQYLASVKREMELLVQNELESIAAQKDPVTTKLAGF